MRIHNAAVRASTLGIPPVTWLPAIDRLFSEEQTEGAGAPWPQGGVCQPWVLAG